MFTFVYHGKTIEYSFTRTNVHIENSYKVKSVAEMKAILNVITAKTARRNIIYKRSMSSWLRKWKAYNILCAHNYQVVHTSSVDFNEKESLFRRIGYFILALFYKEK